MKNVSSFQHRNWPAASDPITPIAFGFPHSVAVVPPSVRYCLQRKATSELSRRAGVLPTDALLPVWVGRVSSGPPGVGEYV